MHRSPDRRTSPAAAEDAAAAWWRTAAFYEVYVRSFADGGDDGVGDLAGVRDRLDYLALLDVDALWLTPFYPSPMADHGYDVADPRDVDPVFGDLATFDELLREAHGRGLRVIIDLVPNHTSDQHPWFRQAVADAPGSRSRARYNFRDGRGPQGREPPNNWLSTFGGPAWTRVRDGQWYLHLFAPEQPDLNWSNPEVTADVERTMRFWLDRGVDGFRIDVAHGMAKPPDLPDMERPDRGYGLPSPDDPPDPRVDAEGVHDIHRMIRRVLNGYPGRMAVGEVWLGEELRVARYVRPDELHLAFNFRLIDARWDVGELRQAIDTSLAAMHAVGAPASWALSNHDVARQVSRYGGGEPGTRRARAAALIQLALPGAAFLYAGDELGLPEVDLPDEARQDRAWLRTGHAVPGRDGARVPLPWGGEKPPYEFTTGSRTWLPMPEGWADLAVEAQLENPDSTLSLYRRALELRRTHPAFRGEDLEWYAAPDGCLAFRRGGGLVCAVNGSSGDVPMPPGEVLLASMPLPAGTLPVDTAVWLI